MLSTFSVVTIDPLALTTTVCGIGLYGVSPFFFVSSLLTSTSSPSLIAEGLTYRLMSACSLSISQFPPLGTWSSRQ